MAFNHPIMNTVTYGCIIALSWFGAHLIVGSSLTTGELASLFTYVMSILMSLMMLSNIFVRLSMSAASGKRVAEVIDEVTDIRNPKNPEMEVKDGGIEFNHVFFSYQIVPGETKEERKARMESKQEVDFALRNVDLKIRKGETVGVIGGTGSGKSSFVNLVSRLYDVSRGSVFVGGKDVRNYDLETLRNNVAVVLQKNVLFSGTILDNLRWGKADATLDDCKKACHAACADEFIDQMPDGYDTHIEEGGSNLSGGQKQRLCIARALLKNPKVLVLDDSTSACDTATDAKIQRAFRENIPGTTRIIISQRISSVQNCDRIIVMEGGKVVGYDTHEALLGSCEVYKEIYNIQTTEGGDFDEKNNTLLRLTGYVLKNYKWAYLTVMICILISSAATLSSTLFTKTLIDDYIVPLTQVDNPEYSSLWQVLFKLGLILALGVICSFAYNKIMIYVSHGTLLKLRKDMYSHMEQLPISYFDTHKHGDIMSTYTNDVDTLRQMVGQSLPQVVNSLITIVITFGSMLILSVPLSLVSVVMAVLMMTATKQLSKLSRKHFKAQQQSLAAVNGYVEEMVSGQKIVKVFCHEQQAIDDFEKINEQLRSSSYDANRMANIVMPVNGNLGTMGYVLIAVVGATLALGGYADVSLGTIVSFLTSIKTSHSPYRISVSR